MFKSKLVTNVLFIGSTERPVVLQVTKIMPNPVTLFMGGAFKLDDSQPRF